MKDNASKNNSFGCGNAPGHLVFTECCFVQPEMGYHIGDTHKIKANK